MNDPPGAGSFTDSSPSGEGRAGPAPNLSTMKIKILCTLGPASLRGDVIRALEERGVLRSVEGEPVRWEVASG